MAGLDVEPTDTESMDNQMYRDNVKGRKGAVFATAVVAITMALDSTAFACVAFLGEMLVAGHDGDTTVVGTGNSYGYCSTGRPTTAAAGHLTDNLTISVSPGSCSDSGARANHQLPEGTYEVRYNYEDGYTDDGKHWDIASRTGCFLSPDNDATTSLLSNFEVDGAGDRTWTGNLGGPDGTDYYPASSKATNLCIGG